MTHSDQNSTPPESEKPVDDFRALLKSVREEAGWRVAPRHIDAALQALDDVGEPPTVARIAELVTELHGPRSQRQQRNADLWRLLGAQLAARSKPGDPDSQIQFIGQLRKRVDTRMSDSTLLMIVTTAGREGHPLEPDLMGDVAVWIEANAGTDPDAEIVDGMIDDAVAAVLEEQSTRAARERRRPQQGRGRFGFNRDR